MKITLIPNLTRSEALKVTSGVCKSLDALGARYAFFEENKEIFSSTKADFLPSEEALSQCDAVIAVGGDGSIIHAAKFAVLHDKPILGINAGRLAYMAGLEDNELDLLSRLIEGDYTIDKRIMLKASIMEDDRCLTSDFCVNDCFITNEEKQRMTLIDVALNGRVFNSYLSDGIVAATPTGSTAYSLSAGGPIVDPELESILITPVCPHSLVDRPLIFRPDTVITVSSAENERLCLSADGMRPQVIERGCRAQISRSELTANFIRIKADSFIDIVYKKLAQRR